MLVGKFINRTLQKCINNQQQFINFVKKQITGTINAGGKAKPDEVDKSFKLMAVDINSLFQHSNLMLIPAHLNIVGANAEKPAKGRSQH